MNKLNYCLITALMWHCVTQSIYGQGKPLASTNLSGNDVEVEVSVFGTLGQKFGPDDDQFGLFKNKTQKPYPVASPFYSTELFMGCLDSKKTVRFCFKNGNVNSDGGFQTGLLSSDGKVLSGSVDLFNRVWKISRIQIEKLKKDWGDNQIIDSTISDDVKYWPGRSNPSFATDLNFELPDQQLAPFFDRNNDGKYNVYDGDLPEASITNSGIVFEELCWSTFYHNFKLSATFDEPIPIQINISTFTTLCEAESYINKTVFQDFNIINKSYQALDSLFVGIWSSPKMGTPEAVLFTFMGTNIGQSSQFTYSDKPKVSNSYAFSEAFTILNQKLSSSIVSFNSGGNYPPAIEYPMNVKEYYNYLTGSWRDGSPIKPTGLGYNPSSSLPNTKYIFYDPPNIQNGFSMSDKGFNNFQMLGSSGNVSLNPNKSYNVICAFSFHQDDDVTAADAHLKHVDKMYDEVPKIRNYYNSNFESCSPPTYCSGADCVWPGDMDKNLQVDYRDFVYLAVDNGATGPKRNPVTGWNWFPQSAENWSTSSPGSNINFKNLDANGDGQLQWKGDELTILYNNGKTSSGGLLNKPNLIFGEGIKLDRTYNAIAKDTILEGGKFALVNINIGSGIDIPDIAGLALNISYDSLVFNVLNTNYLMFKTFQSDTNAMKIYQFNEKYESDKRVNFGSVWVRNDSKNKDPKGLISRLLLKLRTEALGNGEIDTTWIEISGIRAVKTSGEIVSIDSKSIPILYYSKAAVSTNEPNIGVKILVYPNPIHNNRLNIDTKEPITAYRITDILGRLIVNGEIISDQNSIELKLKPGVYSIGFQTKNTWINQLLIKQ